jgi:hypothetical protein
MNMRVAPYSDIRRRRMSEHILHAECVFGKVLESLRHLNGKDVIPVCTALPCYHFPDNL